MVCLYPYRSTPSAPEVLTKYSSDASLGALVLSLALAPVLVLALALDLHPRRSE